MKCHDFSGIDFRIDLIIDVSCKMVAKLSQFLLRLWPFWHTFRNLFRRLIFGCIFVVLWLTFDFLWDPFWQPLAYFWFPLAPFWYTFSALVSSFCSPACKIAVAPVKNEQKWTKSEQKWAKGQHRPTPFSSTFRDSFRGLVFVSNLLPIYMKNICFFVRNCLFVNSWNTISDHVFESNLVRQIMCFWKLWFCKISSLLEENLWFYKIQQTISWFEFW